MGTGGSGSSKEEFGLWSICSTLGCNALGCRTSSECAKMYAARAFMIIALTLATLGAILIIVYFVLRMIRKKTDSGFIPMIGFMFFLCVLADVIGVSVGIAFTLHEGGYSLDPGAFIAIVAVGMNLVGMIILYTLRPRKDKDETANKSNHEDVQVDMVQVSNLSARGNSAADITTMF
ncbi:unnamed protein product [Rotaria sp. Silwood1]|nr:unnamed protein product [Rotaria sp. Silwood1]CAF3664295.1 unnamed protein product [Rotaria sp. Silwood1]CAF3722047.1 unnamed protein product [Rotaria sp. Silwood1]CAF3923817.1 unnamed protein product [Rotaria sp. Silwood1]CAF3924410.1 unnamed protein product [Rotaria sp. Silwood1]